MNIGQRIREVREDLGMQRTVLARRVGAAENTIYRIETGKRTPSVELLEKIARELRIEPAELLRGEPVAAGKAEASETGQADSDLEWLRATNGYAMNRARRLLQVARDVNNPYFRDASIAATWVADIETELSDYCNWIRKHVLPNRSSVSSEDREYFFMVPLRAFSDVEEAARLRLESLKEEKNDVPDALAARRYEKARAKAIEDREHLEEALEHPAV